MKGIDVHGDKGIIYWPEVYDDGFHFAFVKQSEGKTFIDPRVKENVRGAKVAGLYVGRYHYGRPDHNTASEELKHFLAVDRPKVGELLPVLDNEVSVSPNWTLRFLEGLEKKLGTPPIHYTYSSFLDQLLNRSTLQMERRLKRFPLWLADWGPNDGKEHPSKRFPGFNLVIHQFTSHGHLPGVVGNVDEDALKVPIKTLVYKRRHKIKAVLGHMC